MPASDVAEPISQLWDGGIRDGGMVRCYDVAMLACWWAGMMGCVQGLEPGCRTLIYLNSLIERGRRLEHAHLENQVWVGVSVGVGI